VARVLERVPPDVKDLAAERDRVRTELLSQKQRQAWESWVAEARAGAKIDVQSRAPGRG
jgi:parvulin-like peptidyl-prolyl isomerase